MDYLLYAIENENDDNAMIYMYICIQKDKHHGYGFVCIFYKYNRLNINKYFCVLSFAHWSLPPLLNYRLLSARHSRCINLNHICSRSCKQRARCDAFDEKQQRNIAKKKNGRGDKEK